MACIALSCEHPHKMRVYSFSIAAAHTLHSIHADTQDCSFSGRVLMCRLCLQVARRLKRVQVVCVDIFVGADFHINRELARAMLSKLPSLLRPLLTNNTAAGLALGWPWLGRALASTLRKLAADGWADLLLRPYGSDALARAHQVTLPALHTVQLHELTDSLAAQLAQCAQPGSVRVIRVKQLALQSALPQGAAAPWRAVRVTSGIDLRQWLTQVERVGAGVAWELDKLNVVRENTRAHTRRSTILYCVLSLSLSPCVCMWLPCFA